MVNESKLRVRYQETDQMGVVYHANYLIWFETGRSSLMREIGLPYSEFEKNGLLLVVVKAFCEYKHPARYDELVTVVTRLNSIDGPRVTFHYEIKNEKRLLVKGYTEHVFVSKEGRPVALKKANPFLWNRFMSALENSSR